MQSGGSIDEIKPKGSFSHDGAWVIRTSRASHFLRTKRLLLSVPLLFLHYHHATIH